MKLSEFIFLPLKFWQAVSQQYESSGNYLLDLNGIIFACHLIILDILK